MSHDTKGVKDKIISLSINYPKQILTAVAVLTIFIVMIAAVPNFFPETFPFLNTLNVDTDPENMLPHDEPARLFHEKMKHTFNIHEIIGIGIINEENANGVYNAETLKKVQIITDFAKTLTWKDKEGKSAGVIGADLMSPSTVDNIRQKGPGTVSMEWLMKEPPATDSEALELRETVKRLNFMEGLIFSSDEKALAISLPITSKDVSYKIYNRLNEKLAELEGNGDKFHIAGLPVAEDVFGVEMFIQMGIAAPMAMVVIFILMLFFFRKLTLVISPMIVAMASVMITMGLLIISGNTIHIMSSMIAIFIMPIAVLDAVHILSDFFDKYQITGDRKKTLQEIMDTLFKPMFFTSLTTIAGFASLMVTPIPPVKVFGLYVAIGVGLAWFLTILIIPAYIMLMSEESLKNFGAKKEDDGSKGIINKFLKLCAEGSYHKAKPIVIFVLILAVVSVVGIKMIVINDNPTRWFKPTHAIRIADREMNKHLGGTYIGFLTLESSAKGLSVDSMKEELVKKYPQTEVQELLNSLTAQESKEWLSLLEESSEERLDETDNELFEQILDEVDSYKRSMAIFKNPEVLAYIEKLQNHLQELQVVGKTTAVTDIVKIVHRELYSGEDAEYRIPDKYNTVGQTLATFQSGHRADDLWKFVTPSYDAANIWVQLKSGNNIEMKEVLKRAETFFKENPAPLELKHDWFGLTYINVIWQEKMVGGMTKAFLSSFVIVMLMMIFLFRSVLWGILSMIPLSITILLIYGAIGFVGKEYDMPVAVLSSLSLGLAIDYAIHFLARSREIRSRCSSWQEAIKEVFEEPARAIMRNVFVVGVGFLPLLFSPLVPYNTVGVLIAAILIAAGAASIIILPSIITIFEKQLFPNKKGQK